MTLSFETLEPGSKVGYRPPALRAYTPPSILFYLF